MISGNFDDDYDESNYDWWWIGYDDHDLWLLIDWWLIYR